MQEPGSPIGSSPSPKPLRRRRQKRTVYSTEQRQELERFFESNRYPTSQERETLAARLSLQENQVQVWFKNRRAKHAGRLRLRRPRGGGDTGVPQGAGVCMSVPAPVPGPAPLPGPVSAPPPVSAPAGPVHPGGPVFPGCPEFYGPGFCRPPLPSPFGEFPAAESSVSSHSQAWWDPARGAQGMFQAAPAPAHAVAPVWPQGTYDANFSPDSGATPDLSGLLSLQDPFEGSSSATSGYQEGDDFVGENTWKLLSL